MEEFDGVEGFRESEERLNRAAYCIIFLFFSLVHVSVIPFFLSVCEC